MTKRKVSHPIFGDDPVLMQKGSIFETEARRIDTENRAARDREKRTHVHHVYHHEQGERKQKKPIDPFALTMAVIGAMVAFLLLKILF
jgi:hypothetical protein|tara:strand:- start:1933 stop:2196 length:264 start_codon:yes stop_codon:yes gene_type:complete